MNGWFDGTPLADPGTALAAAGALLLGGLVKGLLGMGLPTVAVPLLTYFLPLPVAVGLMSVPVMVSNAAQAIQSPERRPALRRLWPFMLALLIGVGAGIPLLVGLDQRWLELVLGLVLIFFVATNVRMPDLQVPARRERASSIVVGLLSGGIGGMSNLFGPPVAMYFVSLRLPPDVFVAAVSMTFLVGTTPIYVALLGSGILDGPLLVAAALALVPTMAGVWLGQRLRRIVPAARFRQLILLLLAVIGLDLARRGLGI